MNGPQSLLLNALSWLMVAVGLLFIVQNIHILTNLLIVTTTFTGVSLGAAFAVMAVLMGGGVYLKMWQRLLYLRSGQKQTSRQLERVEVSAESSSQQVKALEAKVQTLETALQEALRRSVS